jgi:hypothetical protein
MVAVDSQLPPPVQRDGICVNVAGRLKPALSRWIGPALSLD